MKKAIILFIISVVILISLLIYKSYTKSPIEPTQPAKKYIPVERLETVNYKKSKKDFKQLSKEEEGETRRKKIEAYSKLSKEEEGETRRKKIEAYSKLSEEERSEIRRRKLEAYRKLSPEEKEIRKKRSQKALDVSQTFRKKYRECTSLFYEKDSLSFDSCSSVVLQEYLDSRL